MKPSYKAEEIINAAYHPVWQQLRDVVDAPLSQVEVNFDRLYRNMTAWINNDVIEEMERGFYIDVV